MGKKVSPAHTTPKLPLGVQNGGEGGIRTHGPRERSPVFKTGSFNRSDTSPSPFPGSTRENIQTGPITVKGFVL